MKLQSATEINKAIASIKTRSAKLDKDIHATGVQCLAHAEAHGDFTLCGRLVAAMGQAARRADMIQWFAQFGPVKINKKTFEASMRKKHEDGYNPFDVPTAEKTPVWELIADRAGKLMGLTDVIGGLFSRKAAMLEAQEKGAYVGDFAADLAVVNAAIAATGMDEESIQERKEQVKNLKQRARDEKASTAEDGAVEVAA